MADLPRNAYYISSDYVTDRTSFDCQEVRRVKELIAKNGWHFLSDEDKNIYMHTDDLNRIIGARGCLNVSDLNRYAWSIAFFGNDWNDSRKAMVEGVLTRKGLKYSDYFPEFTLNATALYQDIRNPLTFTFDYDRVLYRYDASATYDIERLSQDIKTVFKLIGKECHNMYSDDKTVFDGITLEELNEIDKCVSNIFSKVYNRAIEIEARLGGELYA